MNHTGSWMAEVVAVAKMGSFGGSGRVDGKLCCR